jgi:two-component system response regulator YesN
MGVPGHQEASMFQVLVAEDELWIRNAIVEMVENLDPYFQVVGEVGNGEEAWEFIQGNWPTMLITDIMMPHRDGIWLCEQIQKQNIPIIILIISGYDDFQYAKQAMRMGASDYLLKPIKQKDLHEAMQRSIQRLESMADFNSMIRDIQKFVDQLPTDGDELKLQNQSRMMVDQVLNFNEANLGFRKSLLSIMSNKLNELLQSMNPAHTWRTLREFDSESEIQQHFHWLISEWNQQTLLHAYIPVMNSIQKVCDYIDLHFMENVSLSDAAQRAFLSVSHFSALFKKSTGQTFLNYLNQVRIDKAKLLLLEPNHKIYEIADQVGYASMPTFNRIFKHAVGLTPAEYRRRRSEKE